MPSPAKRKAVYDDLCNLPQNVTGEIIKGELYTSPWPHPRHSNVVSAVGSELKPPYQFKKGGGPGGWIILIEPEVMLGEDLLVPDLAGWKKERLPKLPKENWISVVPDWVCEILSPSTVRIDRVRKMPIYAEYKVSYFWLIDPIVNTLETFQLKDGVWMVVGNYADTEKVWAAPFSEVEIDLANLWMEEEE